MTWAETLDRLEADLTEVEKIIRRDPGELPAGHRWTPPSGLGPLPDSLVPRVDALLARQFAAGQAIASAMAANRRQAAVTLRLETGRRGRPRPSFVDTAY